MSSCKRDNVESNLVHELGPTSFPLVIWLSFLVSLCIVENRLQGAEIRLVVVRNVEAPMLEKALNCHGAGKNRKEAPPVRLQAPICPTRRR